jgi:gas vesicle protein
MSPKGGKISLLLGVITGALTGLLFAPSKGSNLRKKIAKERKSGGVGYKTIGHELSEMVDEISKMVKDVSQTEEAKAFWHKTHQTLSDLTEGNVDLDKWANQAQKKADLLKKTITQYAKERKKVKKLSKAVKSEWAKTSKKSVKTHGRKRSTKKIKKNKQ